MSFQSTLCLRWFRYDYGLYQHVGNIHGRNDAKDALIQWASVRQDVNEKRDTINEAYMKSLTNSQHEVVEILILTTRKVKKA